MLDMRYRWDLASAAGCTELMCQMYSYLNDSHIDTALKQIVPEL